VFTACKTPDIDITNPIIRIDNISPTPISGLVCGTLEDNVIYAKSTETISFDFFFEDNEALSQYKIDIHNNFDCHGHRGPMTEDWNLQQIEDISGQTNTINEQITVPSNVTAGSYHCSVLLLDAVGNQASTIFYILQIQNNRDTLPPLVSLSQPSTNSININKGSILTVQGTLMDNNNLENGRLELVYFTPSNNKSVPQTLHLDNMVSNTYDYTFNYTIPTSFVSGVYNFEVRAYDAVGNVANNLDFDVVVL